MFNLISCKFGWCYQIVHQIEFSFSWNFFCRIARKKRDKEEQVAYKLEQEIALWDPTANTESTQDQFKTLFVSRINYDTSESKLRREFDSYGPIKSIRMVHDQKTGKPRGYAFIEYEHEKDMHSKYKPIKKFDLNFSSGDQLDRTIPVWFIFIYCWVILQKMGWFENKPHLLISMLW